VVGDTAVALLKAGAETDKRDTDGFLAIDLAPDKEVRTLCPSPVCFCLFASV
jgi:26S proteasome non-ATPase regulatory subunit 10